MRGVFERESGFSSKTLEIVETSIRFASPNNFACSCISFFCFLNFGKYFSIGFMHDCLSLLKPFFVASPWMLWWTLFTVKSMCHCCRSSNGVCVEIENIKFFRVEVLLLNIGILANIELLFTVNLSIKSVLDWAISLSGKIVVSRSFMSVIVGA